MPLALGGTLNQAVLDILEANVREPLQVRGDLHSLAACNEMGCRRLLEMMDEFALSDLSELAAVVIANSREAMLAEIGRLPPGTYRHSMVVDGFERPIELHASMQVRSDGIHVDYSGTSPCSTRGINVPVAYTIAYTAFGIRCMVGAGLNNAGSLAPITIHAPEDCILNAPRPRAVSARQVVGQMLPGPAVRLPAPGSRERCSGARARIAMERAVVRWAEGSRRWRRRSDRNAIHRDGHRRRRHRCQAAPRRLVGHRFSQPGPRHSDRDSRNACTDRVLDQGIAPRFRWRRRASRRTRPDRRNRLPRRRGVRNVTGTCDRILYPARGRNGGGPGAGGWIGLASGRRFEDKFRHAIPPGDRLVMLLPGGGGFGPPAQRAPAALERDMRYGFVSTDAALHDYDRAPDAPARKNDKDPQ